MVLFLYAERGIMDKMKIYIAQGVLSFATASFVAKIGILYWILFVLVIVMVADFISGMAASAKEAIENPEDETKGWSSKKGKLGILKKFGYILVVGAAVVVDYLIYKVGGILNFQMPGSTFFSLLVSVWFILNELLSIAENAGRMGATGLPKFFFSAIQVLKNKVENDKKKEE